MDWMEGLPAPDAVLELMSCSSTHVCKAPQCKCIANGPRCTEVCRLTSCSNMQPDEEPEAMKMILTMKVMVKMKDIELFHLYLSK